MKVYVCKNQESDGDIHLAVFTTKAKAMLFCQTLDTFNEGEGFPLYWEVEVTDDFEKELIKYANRRMI